jgi:hypothetical protein
MEPEFFTDLLENFLNASALKKGSSSHSPRLFPHAVKHDAQKGKASDLRERYKG